MKLHFRAPAGTRIEETEKLTLAVEDEIKKIIPASEIETINDMIGLPTNYNLAFVQTDNVNSMDAEILIALNQEHHPTAGYMRRIRKELPARFPGCSFYFQPADIVAQVLNFGLSSTIDVQVEGPSSTIRTRWRAACGDEIMKVPGTCRRAPAAGARLPHAQGRCRPRARGAVRHGPARRGQRHADFSVDVGADFAVVLFEPGEQRQLRRRGARSHAAHRLGARAARHTAHLGGCSGARRYCARRRRWRPPDLSRADAGQRGRHPAGVDAQLDQPLHRAARDRRRRRHRRARPRLRLRRHRGQDQGARQTGPRASR